MRVRAVIVVIVGLFLLAGTVSSPACEMMCMSAMQTAACCAHVASYCADRTSIRDTRQCSHPQQETAFENAPAFAVQLHAVGGVTVIITTPKEDLEAKVSHISPPGGMDQSSFVPPLRI